MSELKTTLKERYFNEVVPLFMEAFNEANKLAAPRPIKVVINIGVGAESKDAGALEKIQQALTMLAGQKAVFTRAKKSVAGFNIRKGDIVGVRVTLRRQRMWDFLDKLVNIVLPRVKDFKGVDPNAFDNAGNYTLGLVEYFVFPDVDPAKIDKTKGLSIVINFSNSDPKRSRFIMEKLGFIFRDNKNNKK